MTVGTTAVELEGASGAIIAVQNLGPGTLYLGREGVTTANGLQIPVDHVYEPPRPFADNVWLVADAAGTDVRLLGV